jgi:hypothetical protein
MIFFYSHTIVQRLALLLYVVQRGSLASGSPATTRRVIMQVRQTPSSNLQVIQTLDKTLQASQVLANIVQVTQTPANTLHVSQNSGQRVTNQQAAG